MEFNDLMGIARGELDKASANFGADDPKSERYAAFAVVCLSEAAKRHAALDVPAAEKMFQAYLDYWKSIHGGGSPAPPHLSVISGGKK